MEDELTREEERDLALRIQRGDREAFAGRVNAYREQAMAAAMNILQNEEDARDLTQDAFVRAYKSFDRFQPTRPFFPWYYKILRNLCMTHLRRFGRRRRQSFDQLLEEEHVQFPDEQEDAREQLHRQEMAAYLRKALKSIKPKFREIIVMKDFQDMSYEEISFALNIPKGPVMSRLYHASQSLKKKMEKFQS